MGRINGQTSHVTLVCGSTMRLDSRECIRGATAEATMENGIRTNSMALESKPGQTGSVLQEIL